MSFSYTVSASLAEVGERPLRSLVGLLLCLLLPYLTTLLCTLHLLYRARWRRCLLHPLLFTSHRPHSALGRGLLHLCLLAPFCLSLLLFLCLLLSCVLLLPLLFGATLGFLLCLLSSLALLCGYCQARHWQVDAASTAALLLLGCAVAAFELGWLCWAFGAQLSGGFIPWSALLLSLNALPLLVLFTNGGARRDSGESAEQLRGAVSGSVCCASGASSSAALLYPLSLCALGLWGWWMWRLSFGYVAAASAVGLVLMDVVCLLLRLAHHRGGYEQEVTQSIGLVVVCRLGLVVGGSSHFLIGHSIAFAALAGYAWALLLDHIAPTRLLQQPRPFAPSATPAAAPAARSADATASTSQPTLTSNLLGGASIASCAPPSAPDPWPSLPSLSSSFTHLPLLILSLWLTALLFAGDCALTIFLLLTHQLSVDGAEQQMGEAAGAAEVAEAVLAQHPSVCVAAAVAFLSLQWGGLSLSWRLYYNAGYRVTVGCGCGVGLCYVAVVAVAASLGWMDGGLGQGRQWSLPILLLLFVPALALLSLHTFCQWRLLDFRFTVDPAYTRQLLSGGGADGSARQRGLRVVRAFDAARLCLLASLLLLMAGLSASLCVWVAPSVGVSVALSLLALSFTALPLCRWLHSSTWRWWMSAQAALGYASLLSLCLFVQLEVRGGPVDGVAFLLLCLCFLYPAVVCLLLGVCKWANDGWRLSSAVVWSAVAALYALLLLCFLCSLLYPPWYVGAGSLVLSVSLLLTVIRMAPHHFVGAAKGRAGRARSAVGRVGRMWSAAALLCGCVLPVAVGAVFDDGWLAVTSLTAELILSCLAYALRYAPAYFTAAPPIPSLATARLSGLCRPPSSYSLVCSHEWLGLYTLSVLSGQRSSRLSPPLCLRPALLSLYAAALSLYVWAHLAAFFPFSSNAPSLAIDDAADGQAAVSLPAIAAAALLSAALAFHHRQRARAAETAFDANIEALHQRSSTTPESAAEEAADARRGGEAESEEEAEAAACDGAGVAVGEAVGAGVGDDVAAAVRCSLHRAQHPSAALLRALRLARARATRSVHVPRPFSATPSSLRAANTQTPVTSAAPAPSSVLFTRRPSTLSIPRRSVDERLAYQQAVDALLHPQPALSSSSSPSSFGCLHCLSAPCRWLWRWLRGAAPTFAGSSDASTAAALLAGHCEWEAATRLFSAAVRVHLHHLLLVQGHAQLQQSMAMVRAFEAQRRHRRGAGGEGEAAEVGCADFVVSLPYLALLSLHAELRPHPTWAAFERCVPLWQSHRSHLLQLSRSRRCVQEEAKAARVNAAAERARKAETERLEGLSQRRLQRRQRLLIARSAEEDERRERRHQLHLALAALEQQQRSRRERRRRSGGEEDGVEQAEGVEGACGAVASAGGAAASLSCEARAAGRVQRIAAKRRQQREWQQKQRVVRHFVGATHPTPTPQPASVTVSSYAGGKRGGGRGHAAAAPPAPQPQPAQPATAAALTALSNGPPSLLLDHQAEERKEGTASAGEDGDGAAQSTMKGQKRRQKQKRRAEQDTSSAVSPQYPHSRAPLPSPPHRCPPAPRSRRPHPLCPRLTAAAALLCCAAAQGLTKLKQRKRAALLERGVEGAEAADAASRERSWAELRQRAEATGLCTLNLTGTHPTPQSHFACNTCNVECCISCSLRCSLSLRCCVAGCSAVCHGGHQLAERSLQPFYCECGLHTTDCQCLRRGEERAKGEQPRSRVTVGERRWLSVEEGTEALAVVQAECARASTPFVDSAFPHSSSSLYLDPSHPHDASWSDAEWVRVAELFPSTSPPTLLSAPLSPDDVRQGGLGDCWFMSALAVLTLRSELVFGLFLTPHLSECGACAVKVWREGEERVVLVDDYVPAVRGEVEGQWRPLFAQSRGGGCDVWSLLMEKAFAKLFGCYAAIEGGWVDDALMELTGGVSERISLHPTSAPFDGSLFADLCGYAQSGFLLGAGSPVGASDREEDASAGGIVQSHAYSILGLVDVDGHQLVHVRNPWGRMEWTGDWSDHSPLWTERLRAAVGCEAAKVEDDGAFWMSWPDFVSNFDELYVCRFISHSAFPCRGSLSGAWDERTAGGCCNHPTVLNNAQFAISEAPADDDEGQGHAGTEVLLELLQSDRRGEGVSGALPLPIIILEVYDNGGRLVSQQQRGQLKANTGAASLSIHLSFTLPPHSASAAWTLLPCTFTPNQLTSYTLRWYASRQVHIAAFASQQSATQQQRHTALQGHAAAAEDGGTAVQPAEADAAPISDGRAAEQLRLDDDAAASSASASPFLICDSPRPPPSPPVPPHRRPQRGGQRTAANAGREGEAGRGVGERGELREGQSGQSEPLRKPRRKRTGTARLRVDLEGVKKGADPPDGQSAFEL